MHPPSTTVGQQLPTGRDRRRQLGQASVPRWPSPLFFHIFKLIFTCFFCFFCYLCDVWWGYPVLSIHSTLENYLFNSFTSFLLLKNYLVIFPRFCSSVCEPLPGACFPCWVEVAFLLLTAPLWPFTHLCLALGWLSGQPYKSLQARKWARGHRRLFSLSLTRSSSLKISDFFLIKLHRIYDLAPQASSRLWEDNKPIVRM